VSFATPNDNFLTIVNGFPLDVLVCLLHKKIIVMETTTLQQKTKEIQTANTVTPEHIMKVGMGFWASKTLLAAIRFNLFSILADGPLSGTAIQKKLGLHDRGLYDFLDTLVALGFLHRHGLNGTSEYSNTAETDFFLDKNKPAYLGGILEMSNNRLYKYWGDLEEGLITGKPQNELKYTGSESGNQFDQFYNDPVNLGEFLNAMTGVQLGAFMSFAKQFDFSRYHTLTDAGGAIGALCVQVAINNPHMSCTVFDLPSVKPLADEYVNQHNLSDRVNVVSGDFFIDSIPPSGVIVMGNVLHDWNEKEKLHLLKRAYDSLPQGGAFVCIENIIDNDRSKNAFGLMMSLNMLIETKGGFDFTFNDFDAWAHQTGFTSTEWLPLAGPTSAAIAYK
jgi:O-methyltransferase/methyltransferase family protein